jgi:hypothetical protein
LIIGLVGGGATLLGVLLPVLAILCEKKDRVLLGGRYNLPAEVPHQDNHALSNSPKEKPRTPDPGRRIVTVSDYKSCQVGEVVTVVGTLGRGTTGKVTIGPVWLDEVGGNGLIGLCEDREPKWLDPDMSKAPFEGEAIVTGTIVLKFVARRGAAMITLKNCTFRKP